MLFTSLEFLFVFFPVVLIVNFLLPTKARNYWLLFTSLFFYAWGEPKFVVFMLISIATNYLMALLISKFPYDSDKNLPCRNLWIRRIFMAITLVFNLGILFIYKYMNFATATIRAWFPSLQDSVIQTSFILPIGISFFTFQALSYVVDVYRDVPVQKNPAYVGLYISLFPQLIAGPIVRYTTVAEEIKHRTVTYDSFSKGMLRFLYGFNKKMLLANILAQVADKAFDLGELSVTMAWLGIICYTLQIFFDFAGYSEMAIGLGLMFGFRFLENFDYPYISKTITEFWRRWHISLGTWFRDYLYFPLGGSRVKSKFRLVFNLFVVWFATGVWHGASWNFILWGVLYGVIITVEKLLSLPSLSENKAQFRIPYQVFTLLMVMLGWVLFRSESLPSAVNYIKAMFGLNSNTLIDSNAIFYFKEYIIVLLAGILCATPLFKWIKKCLCKTTHGETLSLTVSFIVQIAFFIVCISFLVMNAHNPFIYFNF